jgi:hypothetical protein
VEGTHGGAAKGRGVNLTPSVPLSVHGEGEGREIPLLAQHLEPVRKLLGEQRHLLTKPHLGLGC